MDRSRLCILSLVILVTSVMYGCAGKSSISSYARTGDTIMVALGGTESNALVPVLKKEDIQAVITDSSGIQHDIMIRKLFRIYADQTSSYYNINPQQSAAYIDAYQGQWMAVVDLIDPSTDQAPSLSTGDAVISITSASIEEDIHYSTLTYTNGNLASIAIEILSGQGAPHDLNYMTQLSDGPMEYVEPSSQLLIAPQGELALPEIKVGGVEYMLSYSIDSFGGELPHITSTVPDVRKQLSVNYILQDESTMLVKILLMNPYGFVKPFPGYNVRPLISESPYKSLNVSVFWDEGRTAVPITEANWQNSIQIVSSKFVDINGNKLTELSPLMMKVN